MEAHIALARRVRLAANPAIDKQSINDAERLGFSRLTGSIMPSVMEFALRIEPCRYDLEQAKRLLAEVGSRAALMPVVYDVRIEGVSLVENYRQQFNDIIVSSSFGDVMKKIDARLHDGNG